MGASKRLILWIEGTEDKNVLYINWSATSMGAFKRHTMVPKLPSGYLSEFWLVHIKRIGGK